MKITLVLLNNSFKLPFHRLFRFKNGYAPSTLTTLASLVPPGLEAEIEMVDEGVKEFNEDRCDADLVGLSVVTPAAPRAYRISEKLRSKGKTVVLGGVHPSLLPAEAALYADAVVTGYAEKSWPQLLMDFKNGCLKKTYTEPFCQNRIYSLNTAATRLINKKDYLFPGTLEATRGCINKCSFCVVQYINNNKHYIRPVDEVIDEIKETGSGRIVFLDASPAEDPEYMKELYEKLIPLKIKWFSNITMKSANDPEWLKLAARSGCKGVLIGFESINQSSLDEQVKAFNNTGLFSNFITNLHHHDILILGSFMLGFDHDSKDVFAETYRFVNRTKIDILHYAIFTPFPGTPAFRKMEEENRILTHDWSKYNGWHSVFRPEQMSAEELESGFRRLYRNTHSIYSILNRVSLTKRSPRITLSMNIGFRLVSHFMLGKDLLSL